jgi:hypothetical protein
MRNTDLLDFLAAVSAIDRKAKAKRASTIKNQLDDFFSGIQQAEATRKAQHLREAPSFNVFEILRITYREDGLHTPLLANLLNPRSSHAQSDLFFRRLLKRLLPNIAWSEVQDVEVFPEYFTYNGIFDIFIRFRLGASPFYIVIENKIYAGDQHAQLTRYWNALQELFQVDKNFLIVYLTPDGRMPDHTSMTADCCRNLIASNNLILLRYLTDIAPMLEECLPEIQAPVVVETIRQYIKIIKKI